MVQATETSAAPTVASLADRYHLPADFLRRLDLYDYDHGVAILYSRDGRPARHRLRKGPTGHDQTWTVDDREIAAYGPRLFPSNLKAFDWRLLVEGESDCWAAWHCGLPAIGVPGASMAHHLAADDLADVSKVFVTEEADDEGPRFVRRVVERLRDLGFTGQVLVVKSPVGKDWVDAWRLVAPDREAFKLYVSTALADAVEVPKADLAPRAKREAPATTKRPTTAPRGTGDAAWAEAKRLVLERVDVERAYREWGVRVAGRRPNPKGWLKARAADRDDRTPSAEINVGEGAARGRYRDHGPGNLKLSFWDAAIYLGHHATYIDALAYFATEAGVRLPWSEPRAEQASESGAEVPPAAESTQVLTTEDLLRCSYRERDTLRVSQRTRGKVEPPSLPVFDARRCRRPVGAVLRDRLNPAAHKACSCACRSRNCSGCADTWTARHRIWFAHVFRHHEGELYAFQVNRLEWNKTSTALKRSGPCLYVAAEVEPGKLEVIATRCPAGGRLVSADEASALAADMFTHARPVRRPVVYSRAWAFLKEKPAETVRVPVVDESTGVAVRAPIVDAATGETVEDDGRALTAEVPRWERVKRMSRATLSELITVLNAEGIAWSVPNGACDRVGVQTVKFEVPVDWSDARMAALYHRLADPHQPPADWSAFCEF